MTRALLLGSGLPVIGLVLKATLLIVAGTAIAGLLRNASASARHLVWTLVLAACVAMVVLSPVLRHPAFSFPSSRATSRRRRSLVRRRK